MEDSVGVSVEEAGSGGGAESCALVKPADVVGGYVDFVIGGADFFDDGRKSDAVDDYSADAMHDWQLGGGSFWICYDSYADRSCAACLFDFWLWFGSYFLGFFRFWVWGDALELCELFRVSGGGCQDVDIISAVHALDYAWDRSQKEGCE